MKIDSLKLRLYGIIAMVALIPIVIVVGIVMAIIDARERREIYTEKWGTHWEVAVTTEIGWLAETNYCDSTKQDNQWLTMYCNGLETKIKLDEVKAIKKCHVSKL